MKQGVLKMTKDACTLAMNWNKILRKFSVEQKSLFCVVIKYKNISGFFPFKHKSVLYFSLCIIMNLPIDSSIFVLESTESLDLPGNGVLMGIMVGTGTDPAVILSLREHKRVGKYNPEK